MNYFKPAVYVGGDRHMYRGDALRDTLLSADHFERLGDYGMRNRAVLIALGQAAFEGLSCGILYDDAEEDPAGWPVVFIELPTGQVSWHIKKYDKLWDSHTTETKWKRVHEYCSPDYKPEPEAD